MSAQPTSGKDHAPINIWLVDDNRAVRQSLAELLAMCGGVRCTGDFHSPNALLSALASRPGPDVVLLDLRMGEACGLDAIRPIKALSRGTQVLMFTTCFDNESKKRAFANGATGFLLKHFSIEQILESIRRAVAQPAPHLKMSRRVKSVVLPVQPPAQPRRPLLWLKNFFHKNASPVKKLRLVPAAAENHSS